MDDSPIMPEECSEVICTRKDFEEAIKIIDGKNTGKRMGDISERVNRIVELAILLENKHGQIIRGKMTTIGIPKSEAILRVMEDIQKMNKIAVYVRKILRTDTWTADTIADKLIEQQNLSKIKPLLNKHNIGVADFLILYAMLISSGPWVPIDTFKTTLGRTVQIRVLESLGDKLLIDQYRGQQLYGLTESGKELVGQVLSILRGEDE